MPRWTVMSYALILGSLLASLAVLGGIGALFWWVRRPIKVRRPSATVPLPLFSHVQAAVWVRHDEDEEEDDVSDDLLAARAERAEGRKGTAPSWSVPHPDEGRTRAWAHPPATAQSPRANGSRPAPTTPETTPPTPTPNSAPAPAGTVRFSVPTDATLQFLPGRLEIVTGADAGRTVRFVRTPGSSDTRITFGRSTGAPYHHVQLDDATVSRDHALLEWNGSTWALTNRSVTNPVRHNGVELATTERVPLADGDRLEMGEVTFRFRA